MFESIQLLSDTCEHMLEMDKSMRFASMANNMGSLVVTTYRQRLAPLMTRYETSQYATQAVLRAAIREDFEIKLGKLRYSIGKYEKLIRATVPILHCRNKFYLLLTFDVGSDAKSIIENKVMPYIESNKEILT
jgi:hypothetical protein